jgi:hypothetical protein
MGHEAAVKMNIAAEPVQLGEGDMALEFLRSCESGLELRAPVESIGAFTGLDLNELPISSSPSAFANWRSDCR